MPTDRRLIFIRHAHSPHPRDVGSDHERPISDRGRDDAERVAAHLLDEHDWLPEFVLSSDALRARETWEAMEAALREEPKVRHTRSLYGAEVEDVCNEIWGLSSTVADATLIGHNPGWESVVEWLTGVKAGMRPGSAAVLRGNGSSWTEATQRNAWTFVELVRPEALHVQEED